MSSIIKYYKKIGVTNANRLLTPTSANIDTVKMPILSTIFLLLDKMDTHSPITIPNKKVYAYVVPELSKVRGKVKVFSNKVTGEIRTRRNVDKNIKYITSKPSALTISPSAVLTVDYTYAINNMVFKSTTTNMYDKSYSLVSSLIEDLSTPLAMGKNRFISIELPEKLPSITEFNKLLTKSDSIVNKALADYKSIVLLMLFRSVNKKERLNSPFNFIPDEILEDTFYTFTYNGYMTSIKASYLKGLLNENNVETPIKSYNSDKAFKLLYLYLLKFIISTPIQFNDIEVSSDIYEKMIDLKSIQSIDDLDKVDLDSVIDNVHTTVYEETVIDNDISSDGDILTMDKIKQVNIDHIETGLESLKRKFKEGKIKESVYNKQIERLESNKDIVKDININYEDLIVSDNECNIPLPVTVADESISSNKLNVMTKNYVKKIYSKETKSVIYSLQAAGVVIDNVEETVEEDVLGSIRNYKIKMLLPNGKSNTVNIKMQELNDNGTFKYMGNDYYMIKQKPDVPIKKIDPKTVTLTSFVGKQFLRKGKNAVDDAGISIVKQLKQLSQFNIVSLLIQNRQDTKGLDLPTQYSLIGRYIRSFKVNNTNLIFNYLNKYEKLDKEVIVKLETVKDKVYIGKKNETYYFTDKTNKVYSFENGKLDDTNQTVFELCRIDETKLPIEYGNIGIMGKQIPIVLLLCFYNGITSTLKTLGVKYDKVQLNHKVEDSTKYKIRFLDIALLVDRSNDVANIILGGLVKIEKYTKLVPYKDMDNIDGITTIGLELGLTRRTFSEFNRLRDMFIDPMTKSVLEQMKEPTTYIGLLYRACELLATEGSPHNRDISGVRFAGHERINGMLYKELYNAYKAYEDNPTITKKISINPYTILTQMQTDSTVVMVDDLNPINIIKQSETVTSTGVGGRVKESMSKETRAIHPSEIGVTSEANRDSSDVGITSYLSSNPNINNIRGLAEETDNKDLLAGNVFSTVALLSPETDKDDPKRTLFAGTISGHIIPMVGQVVTPYRTGMESMVASKTGNMYAQTAIGVGVVLSVSKKKIVISYKEGGKETYSLKTWTTKEESGTVYIHRLITHLQKGDKVKLGDIVYYDDAFFEQSLFDPTLVDYKNVVMLNTMFLDVDVTHEDSSAISKRATKILSSNYGNVTTIVVNASDVLSKFVNIGDKLDTSDTITIIAPEYDVNNEGIEMSDASLELLANTNKQHIKASVKGEVVKIKAYYNCDMSEMSNSVKTLVKVANEQLSEDLGKEMTGKVPMNYSVKGNRLKNNSVVFKVYMETKVNAEPGNKLVMANQLKTEVSTVYPDDTKTLDGKYIDYKFGRVPVGARIVNSADKIGTTIKLLDKVTDNIIDIYFK